jgi:hypothetical protein
MAIKVQGTTVIDDSRVMSNLTQFEIPSGTTAQRPSSPSNYTVYLNTTLSRLEFALTTTPSPGYSTQFSGSALYMDSRSWTPSSPVDTQYGIEFVASGEAIKSTNGLAHRISYTNTLGYYDGSYYTVTHNKSNVILPADGTAINAGSVAFQFSGVQGSVVLEEYSDGSPVTSWYSLATYS